MTASAWTDDRVARLKTLWHEGRTAAQIAAELQNGVTRSAVLGKVHRLGLSVGRPERPVARKAADRPPQTQARTTRRADGDGRAPGEAYAVADLPSGGLTILSVGQGQCRWPCGDPRRGVSFCGRPVARGAFCAAHAEVGYRTPPGGLASLLAMANLV
jgi:GcrA cell cycle regulator